METLSLNLAALPVWQQWAGMIALALLAFIVTAVLLKKFVWRVFGIRKALDRVVSQRKSSEVRTGKVAEVFAPLLSEFPVDVKKPGTSTVFLGQPVDFVHFDPEEGITFIEVKSGDARLSALQRKLRERVEAGDIHWAEVTIRGEDL